LQQVKQRAAAGGFSLSTNAEPRIPNAGPSSDIETLSSIAQRWILAHANVCSVIPGFRNPKQAACNVAAARHGEMGAGDVEWLRGVFN
jgi:aryl-alcohol dehydrogenase-like predicted oxidoreductase